MIEKPGKHAGLHERISEMGQNRKKRLLILMPAFALKADDRRLMRGSVGY
jgi:hypothetical protein